MRPFYRGLGLSAVLLLASGIAGCGDDDGGGSAFDRQDCMDDAVDFLNSLDPEDLAELSADEADVEIREAVGDECFDLFDNDDFTDEEAEEFIERLDPEILEVLSAGATTEEFESVGESIDTGTP